MLKIQQTKTKETKTSQTRKVSIYDENFDFDVIITYELVGWHYRLIIKWQRNKKKLWADWISEVKYDKKVYHMWKFEINKKLILENFYKNEKNISTYYTIDEFLDKVIEELRKFEENN